MAGFEHKPVLVEEVLAALKPRAGGRYVDGTVGGAGHATRILQASAPDGYLVGFDQDAMAIEAATARLSAEFAARFELHHANYASARDFVADSSCDGVVLDLGVSSPQLDRPERGFSFMAEGPLDMRQDQRQRTTAADIVNRWSADELARIFWELGGERDSRRLARVIERERAFRKIETTRQLAELIESASPRHGRKSHPATKIFLALRMEVNTELPKLAAGLEACWSLLKPGGTLAVITFHSLEDRMVKDFGRNLTRDYDVIGEVDVPELRKERAARARWIVKRTQPSDVELAENPRARSAQLRAIEKLGETPSGTGEAPVLPKK
jgi:16S rRNA (cytosine1402-N4)-methyltransferase